VANATKLLIHCKYIVLSNRNVLSVCHGRFEVGVVLGFFVNESSKSLGSFRMSILSNPSPIKGYVHHHFLLF